MHRLIQQLPLLDLGIHPRATLARAKTSVPCTRARSRCCRPTPAASSWLWSASPNLVAAKMRSFLSNHGRPKLQASHVALAKTLLGSETHARPRWAYGLSQPPASFAPPHLLPAPKPETSQGRKRLFARPSMLGSLGRIQEGEGRIKWLKRMRSKGSEQDTTLSGSTGTSLGNTEAVV